jgi:hypothetical protein
MSETKFTPGPWIVKTTPHPIHRGCWREIEDRENGCVLAEVYNDEAEDEPFIVDATASANARLIAAAPALYEALRDLMQVELGAVPPRDLLIRASAALASADTHPKGGDAVAAPSPMSGAVPAEEQADAQPSPGEPS